MTDQATPSGIIVVDKPPGPSSMQTCARIRGRLKAGGAPKRIKVGHGGTLDPLASGVLVVMVGRATKLCERVMAGTKTYITEVDFAHTSPTDDAEGEAMAVACSPVPREQIEAACVEFQGEIMQIPPAYSAMKVDGKRAYQLARAGKAPNLEPRPIRIDACTLLDYSWPTATLEVTCGRGTYIRTLARDLGASVGAGGMLLSLRRTKVGPFTLDDSVTYETMPEVLSREDLRDPALFDL
ncbi:MAG: tRNA pseudouridine(55) synthase TruB [Planctomycetota bacterium]